MNDTDIARLLGLDPAKVTGAELERSIYRAYPQPAYVVKQRELERERDAARVKDCDCCCDDCCTHMENT